MNKFFKISERGSNVRTEIIAGLTTFFAMAYILVVNPNQIVGFSFGVPGIDKIWNAVYIATIVTSGSTKEVKKKEFRPIPQDCAKGILA